MIRMFNSIKRSFQSFFYLFYPRVCSGCGNGLVTGEEFICLNCHDDLMPTDFVRHRENTFYNALISRIPIEGAVSYYFFAKEGIIQNLLHEIKYKGKQDLGRYIGRQFGVYLNGSQFIDGVECIIPIPLHDKKAFKRGYNQSALIAEGLSEILEVPMLDNVVQRKLSTTTQTNLSRVDRWENVKDAFVVEQPDKISGKHVLLIDDVMTTGATLEACARKLLELENVKVSLATLAFASEL